MANKIAEYHARAHVIMMAAGMPHEEVLKSAHEKHVKPIHLDQMFVQDQAQENCRRLLKQYLRDGIN